MDPNQMCFSEHWTLEWFDFLPGPTALVLYKVSFMRKDFVMTASDAIYYPNTCMGQIKPANGRTKGQVIEIYELSLCRASLRGGEPRA
jgi:hypothetical protein